jgi:hypothetical protein
MKLSTLKKKMREHLYMEDEDILDVIMAAAITNIMQLGQPVWLVIIGAPSSGKTQYIAPLEYAQPAGKQIIHEITDITPNTFLSGSLTKKASEFEPSLLKRIGDYGILLFPDLTALFSKETQTLHEILGQLRHIYDGHLTKLTGNQEPITWKGKLGIIGASTASLYRHFEEIADMGERFMYYRMKPYDIDKAVDKSLGRTLYGQALDEHIGEIYGEYLSSVIQSHVAEPVFSEEDNHKIKEMAKLASVIRTSVHVNERTREVDRIPEPEMPMRTALQLRGLALGMCIMNENETGKAELTEKNLRGLEWCAFSLANDERRKTLQALAEYPAGCNSAAIGMTLGLPTNSASSYLQELAALRVCRRLKVDGTNADLWQMEDENMREIILRLSGTERQDGALIVEEPYEEVDDFGDPLNY